MTSSLRIGASPLACAVTFVALAACGGRAGSAATSSPSDAGSASRDDGSTTQPATSDDGGGGGDRTFGDGSSYDAVPPRVTQNGPAPGALSAGSLVPGTCPIAMPASGDACNVAGARCSYGDSESPDVRCRDWVVCSGQAWAPEPKPATSCDDYKPICNADKVEDLRACRVDCHFANGTVCMCRASVQTECAIPTADPNCPPFAPNQGVTCASHALCTYGLNGGTCGYDAAYAGCIGNVWVLQNGEGCHD